MISLSGGRADPELTKLMVEGSGKARDWLTTLGVPWKSKSRDPRAADQVDGQGKVLAGILRRAVAARKIKILHETEAYGLVLEGRKDPRRAGNLEQGAMAGMRSMKKYEVGILVNQQGDRFVDEGEPGEITTGIFCGNYAGGSSLPRCAVYGRIAGEGAAGDLRQ